MTEHDQELAALLDEVAERLGRAQRLLFITGAGISADSGLPTYRGVGGLYNGEATGDGIPIETALSGEVFAVRPDITWKYLAQIEAACRGASPNPAHQIIARLADDRDEVLVFTQNVDGFHDRAGSRDLVEIHGNLQTLDCTVCDYSERVSDYGGLGFPPACPACGGLLRPRVVLFGESLPEGGIDRLLEGLETGFDMVFTIGTSGAFPYISQPVAWAAQSGMFTVEINPVRTGLSDVVAAYLPLGAAEAMRALWQRLHGDASWA